MAQWKMQAVSSTDGKLYAWLVSAPDWTGAFYTGPGSPSHIALASRPSGSDGGGSGLVVSGTPTVTKFVGYNGSAAVWTTLDAHGAVIPNVATPSTGTDAANATYALSVAASAAANVAVDGATLQNVSGTLSVKSLGITDAKVSASAAIAGTKISPNFGAQNVVTTGNLTLGSSPAASGLIAAPYNTQVMWRNAAGTADLQAIRFGGTGSPGSNNLIIGDPNATTTAVQGTTFEVDISSNVRLLVTSTLITLSVPNLTFSNSGLGGANVVISHANESSVGTTASMTVRAQSNSFAGAPGGDLFLQAGSSLGASGSGGSVGMQPGTGVTANGEAWIKEAGGTKQVRVNTTGIGFFNTTPIAKPTVTGSRGANAALASLLTNLASYGLLTDSST